MPTLENIQGSSLIADVSKFFGSGAGGFMAEEERAEKARLLKEKEEQKELERNKRIDTEDVLQRLSTPGISTQEETALFARLGTLIGGPTLNAILQAAERGDKNELEEDQRITDKALKVAIFLDGIEDPVQRLTAIREEAEKASANGEDIGKFLELADMSPERQKIAIRRQIVTATDIKTLLANMQKKKEAKNKAFTKPSIKDFTPESVQKFIQTKNPGDLVAVGKGPSSQVTAALLPLLLGGVDLNNPAEMIQALALTQQASAALSGSDPAELNQVLQTLRSQAPPLPPPTPERGPIGKGLDFAKDKLGQAVDFSKEKVGPLLSELADLFRDVPNPLRVSKQAKTQALVKELRGRGLRVELRGGKPTIDGRPIEEFLINGDGEDGSVGSVVADDFEVFDSIRKQHGQDPLVDEEGFFFVPNRRMPGGKQFVRDKETGQKVRSSRFR